MRVLLVDVGSTIPNLALMRLSAWYKGRGAAVDLFRVGGRHRAVPLQVWDGRYDLAFVSCVFSWDRSLAELQAAVLRRTGVPVILGGSGHDWGRPAGAWSELPDRIEATLPDYSLYGDGRAIGFCQRGCIRKCDFCLVSKKEGTMDRYPFHHPREWVPDGMSKVLLLDNEFAAQQEFIQRAVVAWLRETGRRWSITQGYDLRILARNPGLAGVLADLKPMDLKFHGRSLYCAWDYPGTEPAVRAGIRALYDAGFKGREICVYMLCGFGDTHEDDLHRFNVLWRELGAYPYVMVYNRRRDDEWLNRFARFVNRRVFKACTWEDYDRREHDRLQATRER